MDDNFATLFAFLPIGAYRSHPDGTQLRANPALVRLNGYDSEDAQRQAVRDIGFEWYVQPQRRAEFTALLEAHGTLTGFESEVYRHRTREKLWVSENAHVVRDAHGQVLYYEGTVEDITARVQAQRALQRSEDNLREVAAHVPGALYRLVLHKDGSTHIDYISEGVRALLGLDPAQAVRDPGAVRQLRHPADRQRVAAELALANSSGAALRTEYRVLLADGQEKWIQQHSSAVAGRADVQLRIGVLLDITARKQAELALHENSGLWKRALESSCDGLWDWHVQAGVEVLSPQCKALYGFAEHELPDTPDALDDRTHPDDVPDMLAARRAHFAGRTPAYVNEHRVQCKDGQWKWILARGFVIQRDAQGAPLRMIGTHTDITHARQAEALRHERDRAAAADLAKSQFLSRVSHELRTPLNAVMGFAQLLELDLGDGDRQRGWLRQILSSGQHLLALMEDILDLSSVQTGQLSVSTDTLWLRPVLDEALLMQATTARQAGVTVVDHSDPELQLRADRKRLLQIVNNLLSNAIKYNHPGGWVRLQTQVLPGDEMELRVADSGPGLNPEQRARLFQPFERLGAQRGVVQGTGLGLALCRQLAQAMGGSVTVESEPGQGAVFVLRLPAAAPADEAGAESAPESTK